MAVKGAILGDILGSPYEFKRVREYDWKTVPLTGNPLLLNMGRKKDETFFSPYFPDPFVQMDKSKEYYFQQVMSAVMMRVERGCLFY